MKYTHKDGVIERRRGRPIPRHGPPPCDTCPKIPPGVEPRPENAETLCPENQRAYEHWQECEAVHWQGVPEASDPIVRRNAAIIREVREQVHRVLDQRAMRWMVLTIMGRRPRE